MSKIAVVKLEQFWQYKRQNDQMYNNDAELGRGCFMKVPSDMFFCF